MIRGLLLVIMALGVVIPSVIVAIDVGGVPLAALAAPLVTLATMLAGNWLLPETLGR